MQSSTEEYRQFLVRRLQNAIDTPSAAKNNDEEMLAYIEDVRKRLRLSFQFFHGKVAPVDVPDDFCQRILDQLKASK